MAAHLTVVAATSTGSLARSEDLEVCVNSECCTHARIAGGRRYVYAVLFVFVYAACRAAPLTTRPVDETTSVVSVIRADAAVFPLFVICLHNRSLSRKVHMRSRCV